MQDQEHYAHDEQEVDQTGAHVECQKPKQPKNNQNQGD
jgi:hypothetical protein